MADEVTVAVLREIRDEVRSTRTQLSERIDDVSDRIDSVRTELSERIDKVSERMEALERRQTQTEVRLATELVAVVGAVREVRDTLREGFDLGRRVADHEARLARIEKRLG